MENFYSELEINENCFLCKEFLFTNYDYVSTLYPLDFL